RKSHRAERSRCAPILESLLLVCPPWLPIHHLAIRSPRTSIFPRLSPAASPDYLDRETEAGSWDTPEHLRVGRRQLFQSTPYHGARQKFLLASRESSHGVNSSWRR